MALPPKPKTDEKEVPSPEKATSPLMGFAVAIFIVICGLYICGLFGASLKSTPPVTATFDKATKTCSSPFNKLGQEDGINRGQCFHGHTGSVLIQLKEPLYLEDVNILFDKQAGKTKPKHVIFFGSEYENGEGTVVSVRIDENSNMKLIPFAGANADGHKPHPVKFLRIVILSNWGAPITTFENVQLVGFTPVVVKVF